MTEEQLQDLNRRWPDHDKTSCSDQDPCNAGSDPGACRRCTAISLLELDRLKREAGYDDVFQRHLRQSQALEKEWKDQVYGPAAQARVQWFMNTMDMSSHVGMALRLLIGSQAKLARDQAHKERQARELARLNRKPGGKK